MAKTPFHCPRGTSGDQTPARGSALLGGGDGGHSFSSPGCRSGKRRWPLSVCNSGEYLQLGRRTRAEVRSPGLWAAFRTFLCAWPGLLGSKWGLPGVPLPPGLLSSAGGAPQQPPGCSAVTCLYGPSQRTAEGLLARGRFCQRGHRLSAASPARAKGASRDPSASQPQSRFALPTEMHGPKQSSICCPEPLGHLRSSGLEPWPRTADPGSPPPPPGSGSEPAWEQTRAARRPEPRRQLPVGGGELKASRPADQPAHPRPRPPRGGRRGCFPGCVGERQRGPRRA